MPGESALCSVRKRCRSVVAGTGALCRRVAGVVVLCLVRVRCVAMCRVRAVFGMLLLELNRALCVESSWNPLLVFAEELYLSLYYRS